MLRTPLRPTSTFSSSTNSTSAAVAATSLLATNRTGTMQRRASGDGRTGLAIVTDSVSPDHWSARGVVHVTRSRGQCRAPGREVADAETPMDRDLHPMCTLREQTPRRTGLVFARKSLNNKEKIRAGL